ncbi:MAG TPA: ester cyclase [Rhodothermales bacterium]|nr:ester cyclase [Rhodothermales bacterium]
MSVHNKTALRRLFEEGWNLGHMDVVNAILAPDFVGHFLPPGVPAGPEGFCLYIAGFRTAFPDLHMQIDDMIAEGDTVAIRITFRGTHTGPLMHIPPTNNEVTLGAMIIARFDENGHYVEGWGEHDKLSLMQQLDVIPAYS